jgi:tetratricopeptide (TPR) repeat protein
MINSNLQLEDALAYARFASRVGAWQEALRAYGEVFENDPARYELIEQLNHCLLELGQPDRARSLLEAHLKHRPDSVQGLVGLADFAIREQQWKEALVTYHRALDLDPSQEIIHRRIANLSNCLGTDELNSLFDVPAQAACNQLPSLIASGSADALPLLARSFLALSGDPPQLCQVGQAIATAMATGTAIATSTGTGTAKASVTPTDVTAGLAPLFLRLVEIYGCRAALHPPLPAATPAPLPPPADQAQREELQRDRQLSDLSFDWCAMGSQFKQALHGVTAEGRRPLIVDAGTLRGGSANWLAKRWPQALVVALQRRQIDSACLALAAANGAGFELRSAVASAIAHWLSDPELAGPISLPLGELGALYPPDQFTPLLLHLDTASTDMAALFSGPSNWLQQFPLVLIRGGLAADPQGRTLPQPYHQAFATGGYELLRSGSVLVAFNRPRLVELAAADLITGAVAKTDQSPSVALPAELSGQLVVTPSVVAFDGEWQYPAITEQRAFQLCQERLPAVPGSIYVGFPWASLIDHLNNGTSKGRQLLQALDALLPQLQGYRRRITTCQQIFFQQHRWLLERAGITDVFWPHATIYDDDPSLRIHPFPLFPVNWQIPAEPEPTRDVLYSFIGAHATRLYLSNSRDLILDSLNGLPGALVHGNDHWFYQDLVYGVQIRGTISADDIRAQGNGPEPERLRYIDSLSRSRFCLCPSGTGPNTIRLWEAIGSGAIPVILSDRFRPPGPRELWDQAVFVLPDTAEGVLAIPQRTQQWAADAQLMASKRAGLKLLWQRYGPDTFITDILELHQQADHTNA